MEELDRLIEEFMYKCYKKIVNDELVSRRERLAAKEYVDKNMEFVDAIYYEHSKIMPIELIKTRKDFYQSLILNYYRFGRTINQQLFHYFSDEELENIHTEIMNYIHMHHLYSKYEQRQKHNIYAYEKSELEFIYAVGDLFQENKELYQDKMEFFNMSYEAFSLLYKRIKVFKLLYPNEELEMDKIPSNIYQTIMYYFKKADVDCIELEKFIPFSKNIEKYYNKAKIVKIIYPDKKVLYRDLPKDNFSYILKHYGKEHDLGNLDQLREVFPMVSIPFNFEQQIHMQKYLFPGYTITYERWKQSIDYSIIDYILEAPSYDKINEVLEKSGKNVTHFRGILHNYLLSKGYSKEKYEKKRKEVIDCFDYYTNEKQKKMQAIKIQERELLKETAIATIEDYLASNMKKGQYVKEQKMKDFLFYKYLDIVKEYNFELYEKYMQNSVEKQKQRFLTLCEKGLLVIEKINSDVTLSDGTTRKFDILDFYEEGLYVTQDICKAVQTSKKIDNSTKRSFKNFVDKNKILKPNSFFDRKRVLEEKVVIHVEFDKRGNIIEGSGHIVTEEEKLSIMDYLVSHHIPLNKVTYNAAFKRFKENTLFIDENKEKVHVKNFT